QKRLGEPHRARRDRAQNKIGHFQNLFCRVAQRRSGTFSLQSRECRRLHSRASFAKPGLAGRGQPVEIISHGTQVDINQHLARGYVTIVDFYADWCPACRWLSPRLEQMAASDPQIALRKIDIVNWKTAVARQFTIDSLPWVSIYNRVGQLIGTVSGADIDQIK